jgi:hypothetical protein
MGSLRTAAAVVVGLAALGVATPSHASSSSSNVHVKATAQGVDRPGKDQTCDFVSAAGHGTVKSDTLSGRYTDAYCVDVKPSKKNTVFTLTGTFELTTKHGNVAATLNGTLTEPANSLDGTVKATLTVTGGTKAFAGATGHLTLNGPISSNGAPNFRIKEALKLAGTISS